MPYELTKNGLEYYSEDLYYLLRGDDTLAVYRVPMNLVNIRDGIEKEFGASLADECLGALVRSRSVKSEEKYVFASCRVAKLLSRLTIKSKRGEVPLVFTGIKGPILAHNEDPPESFSIEGSCMVKINPKAPIVVAGFC